MGAISVIILGLTSAPAQATIYNLTFNNNSISGYEDGRAVISVASFDPITLFDGDTLSIVFNNVPSPTNFPKNNPATDVDTILYGLGGGGAIDETVVIAETVVISGDRGASFGPRLMREGDGSTFLGFDVTGGIHYGPTWTISLELLSGEPPTSSGLAVDQIWIQATLVPEPSTWAMMLLGFAGVGFMAYRRKSKPALTAA